jgi:asparagine synthase (glutamine-hydrolysing)
MCGIAALINFSSSGSGWNGRGLIESMASAMIHRGPDDGGIWESADSRVCLGHRRLSVVELSAAGHQPMQSFGGRSVLVFNGEIYNAGELRLKLQSEGAVFRGGSDTEVMLAACERWGIAEALRVAVGMFALAWWDNSARRLHLARDRMGEKPLFYGVKNDCLIAASELKAIRSVPGLDLDIDRDALALFLRHAYVPTPYSIYRGIGKLPPGTFLTIDPMALPNLPAPVPYWSLSDVAVLGLARPFAGSAEDASHELEALLRHAIKGQMIADVPLGAFLSGGIDSSTIVALMQAQSSRPVRTFTIGSEEAAYNEADYARAVARYLGTEHTELVVTASEARAVIPRLPILFDEPFGDSSQIPMFLVSKLARQSVTVGLSGDGGDELFGGYNRYPIGRQLWSRVGWVPRPLRALAATILRSFSPGSWDAIAAPIQAMLPRRLRQGTVGDKVHKLAGVLGARSPDHLYRALASFWNDPEQLVIGSREPVTRLTDGSGNVVDDFTERMMLLDQLAYLPDDILVKVDRAAMGVSLETRIPFLDHRVVEFAWRLPLAYKLRNGRGKLVVREVLSRHVPTHLVDRPKAGFGIPIGDWLRGPLREWGESLLAEERLRREGYLEPGPIRAIWNEHLAGRRPWQYHLWSVLMFQAWLGEQRT